MGGIMLSFAKYRALKTLRARPMEPNAAASGQIVTQHLPCFNWLSSMVYIVLEMHGPKWGVFMQNEA